MSTLQSFPTTPPRTRRAVLPIAVLLALVVGAAGVILITAGDDGDPARTEFRLPSHVTTHGGAPVPELSSAARPKIGLLPPTAAPFPQDLRSPDARDASAPGPPAQDLRSPDARVAGR